MTDEEILVRAMDAEPSDIRPMAALADLLLGQDDARGEGLAVLVQYGKVGRPARSEICNVGTPWEHERYEYPYVTRTDWEGHGDRGDRVIGAECVIDVDWWSTTCKENDGHFWPTPSPSLARFRMLLADSYAVATPDARRRWAFNTGGETAAEDLIAESKRWLSEYAARIDSAYEVLMGRAAEYQAAGTDWHCGDRSRWLSEGGFDDPLMGGNAFWSHYAVVTDAPLKRDGNWFECCL